MTGVRFPSATKTNSPAAQARAALRGTTTSSAAETTTQPARYTASQTISPIACIPTESPNGPAKLPGPQTRGYIAPRNTAAPVNFSRWFAGAAREDVEAQTATVSQKTG